MNTAISRPMKRNSKSRRSARTYVALLLLLLLCLGWPHRTRSQTSAPTGGKAPTPVPQRILYEQTFKHIVYLDIQADAAGQSAQNGNALRNYYQNQAGLTATETALLKSTAHSAITALLAVDQQIHASVVAYRAQFQNGKWPRKTPLPPVPPEFKTLQATKDNITLNGISTLQSGFGSDRFQHLDTYVQNVVGPRINVTSVPLPTLPVGVTPPAAPPAPWK